MQGPKTIGFEPKNMFVNYKCLPVRAFKKVNYGYCGKNGQVSDLTERTYSEIYSSLYFFRYFRSDAYYRNPELCEPAPGCPRVAYVQMQNE